MSTKRALREQVNELRRELADLKRRIEAIEPTTTKRDNVTHTPVMVQRQSAHTFVAAEDWGSDDK